jgi:hypothetical protein
VHVVHPKPARDVWGPGTVTIGDTAPEKRYAQDADRG